MAYKLDGSSPVMVPIKLETLQSIVQLLFVDLTEGEFETDYEQNKVQGLLMNATKPLRKLNLLFDNARHIWLALILV